MFCDRDIREGSEVVIRFGSHVKSWCIRFVVDLIVSDVYLMDKLYNELN